MRLIIYANMLPIFALLSLTLMVKINHLFDKRQSKLFYTAIVINMILIVAVSFDYLFVTDFADAENIWMFRRFTSFLNFAGSPLLPVILYCIFLNKKNKQIFYLPLYINVFLCGLSMFWNVVFKITPENTYDRGPLFLLPFICSIIYLVMLIAQIGKHGKRGKKSEQAFLIFVIAIASICMFLEIKLNFRFLSWDMVALCLILYYLLININRANADFLTGAFNRGLYMKDLCTMKGAISSTLAVIDINEFKMINDLQGHAEGDRQLVRFAQVMMEETGREANFYRTGGDEFAVLSKKWPKEEMLYHMEQARKTLEADKIDFACGIIEYQSSDILDDVLEKADEAMYTNKKQMKICL